MVIWLLVGASLVIAEQPVARLRRPVALQLTPDEQQLLVVNQRAGTLSVVDLKQPAVVRELTLGKKPTDLVSNRAGSLLLIPDELGHELLLVEVPTSASAGSTASAPPNQPDPSTASAIKIRQRLAVSPFPVSVVMSPDERHCYVASLWSRRVTVVKLPESAIDLAKVERTIDLEIAPRKLLMARQGAVLLAADSFAGKLAVIDVASQVPQPVLGLREFPAHNIRGMGINADGSMLILSHQMLNELAHTIRNDVHWGLLMSNDLRWLKLDQMIAGGQDLFAGGHMHPLGGAGSATADPAGLTLASDGTVIVALAGVGEIASGQESDFSLHRTAVGQRPVAVVATRDAKLAYVANMFSDSISIVDLDARERKSDFSLGPNPALTLADEGELLFYDGRQSHDGWMSCHSCHTDGHTNGQLNDNFSDKSFGAPKRVLTLLGRADTAPFAWNASSPDLAAQIRKSLNVTMQAPKDPSDKMVEAIAAYVTSLESPPSVDRLRGTLDEAAVNRGREVFEQQRCQRCHAPPTFTTPKTYNVGLKDQQGNDHFNPPSLRGVAQRAPYFHDNRAATLERVFGEFRHQLKGDLTDAQLADLLCFLRSL
ncbi:MAG: cytochrome c peroxidase [Planctomycetota bacterium]